MNHSFSVEHAMKYGLHESILIGNLQFWLAKNRADKRNQHDGRTWTYNTSNAFSELLPYFSADAIDRIIKKLVKQNVIILGNYNVKPSDRTRWMAFVNETEFLGPTREQKKVEKAADDAAGKASREIAEGLEAPAKSRNANRESAEPSREIAESLYRTDITSDVTTDKNLQTASAAAPEVRSGEPAAKELAAEHPAEALPQETYSAFEAAWSLYPARAGNAKHLAQTAWKARVAEGISEKALLDGVKDYAAHCKREKVAAKFVMTAGRFLGGEGHYAANWAVEAPEQLPFFADGDFSDNVRPL